MVRPRSGRDLRNGAQPARPDRQAGELDFAARERSGHGPRHPVEVSVEYPDRSLNRVTTFFRAFTAIPIIIVLAGVTGAGPLSTLHAESLSARPLGPRAPRNVGGDALV